MRDTYSFLGKLLGLTTSSNPNERNAAEAKLQQQLTKRGMTLEELENNLKDNDQDEDLQTPVTWTWVDQNGKTYNKRIDPAMSIIVNAVSTYFNGCCVQGQGEIEVFATKGNKIQIILYSEYLMEDMDRKLGIELLDRRSVDRTFKNSYRKNYAAEVWSRLKAMKDNDETYGARVNGKHTTAMVLRGRNDIEKQACEKLRFDTYGKLGSGSGYRIGGSGASAGRSAGSSVGLNKQVSQRGAYRLGAGK